MTGQDPEVAPVSAQGVAADPSVLIVSDVEYRLAWLV
jgi:hypothetical protein